MDDSVAAEVEFTFQDSELYLLDISDETGCRFELELVRPWTNRTVLEHYTTHGAAPDEIQKRLEQAPEVKDSSLIDHANGVGRFELRTTGQLTKQLAVAGSILTDITVVEGVGKLKTVIPPHTDASTVIETFLEAFPSAELTGRRTTSCAAMFSTEDQFISNLLSELTEKQRQALEVAHGHGYFESPRQSTGQDIAADLGISSATFSQHLRAGLDKILRNLFG